MSRIIAFGLTTPDAARLARFYERAFGCRSIGNGRVEGAAFERLMAVDGGARRWLLRLGDQAIELLQFDAPGRAYAQDGSPLNPVFQHFAIVVDDIERAVDELSHVPEWTPISTGGPQRLPPRSGSVVAFKFRDPDGHPLEFLEFPPGAAQYHGRPSAGAAAAAAAAAALHRGIDHSAMSVRDTAASVAFYESLGFHVAASGVNMGVEQARLDGVADPVVAVTTLRSTAEPPHLELLCYETMITRGRFQSASNDVSATRILLECDVERPPSPRLLSDPDGHRVVLYDAASVRNL